MELCDHGHSPVCYEGLDCPMCDLLGKLAVCEKDRDYLRERLEAIEEAVKG